MVLLLTDKELENCLGGSDYKEGSLPYYIQTLVEDNLIGEENLKTNACNFIYDNARGISITLEAAAVAAVIACGYHEVKKYLKSRNAKIENKKSFLSFLIRKLI